MPTNRLDPAARAARMLALLAATLLPVLGATAQDEKPENLKVLPETITNSQLRSIMQGFNRALGVRCSHCHVEIEGTQPPEHDFASDDKAAKLVAREMMRMTQAINQDYIAQIERAEGEPLQVSCITCHRGVPRPEPLEDVLAGVLPAHGVDSTMATYRQLRERHYGGFAYDFQEQTLVRFAERLIGENRAAEAMPFLRLNAEQFPNSAQTFALTGEAHAQLGDRQAAVESYEQAVRLNPDNPRLKQRLEQLKRQ